MGISLIRRISHTDEQLFAPLIPLSFAEGTPSVSIAPGYRFRGISGGGLFVRYPLTDALTLSATVNADSSSDGWPHRRCGRGASGSDAAGRASGFVRTVFQGRPRTTLSCRAARSAYRG